MQERNHFKIRKKLLTPKKLKRTASKVVNKESSQNNNYVLESRKIDKHQPQDSLTVKNWVLTNDLITPEVHRSALMADDNISKIKRNEDAFAGEAPCKKSKIEAEIIADIFRHLGWVYCLLRDQDTAEKHFHTASKITNDKNNYFTPPAPSKTKNQKTLIHKLNQQSTAIATNTATAFMLKALNFRKLLDIGNITNAEHKDNILKILSESAALLKFDRASPIAILEVVIERSALAFAHVEGDYIPGKIKSDQNYYEADFLSALNQLISQPGAVIDIGANIGNHTVYFAKSTNRKIIAFEPEPLNHLCLLANIALNNISSQVQAHEIALGNSDESITLTMAIEGNHGSFTRINTNTPTAHTFEISSALKTKTLDAALQEYHRDDEISLLKIDVEGMELEVLNGGIQTIKKNKPIIACECSTENQLKNVEYFLEPLGYANVKMMNATPTFIFLNLDNIHHRRRLLTHLREKSIYTASRRETFSHPAEGY